ncbi:hypothetical protein BJF93_15960 [Xaviernesmea oryzae]|uniref:HPr kinase/phosphorylase n=1 Tax=Xaviernesmea oryzae TaxID=464029 RepID=A0A1Q9AYD8_9HYPH|nr:hypothetical protein [Xaviernesmea oryzae]OLP60430.1 hypothetical protein BJF93_15960 [Xaviernesmea oryzae]SEK18983.1 hypothetical protein SAMN04487976_10124 [Xaviernesmea oryzae]
MSGTFIHATAVVVGTTGLLFIGPSGSGKTILALAAVEGARRAGLFSAFVGDDQVLIASEGGVIIARQPPVIAGLAEIRGSAIVPVFHVPAAVMDYAVRPVALEGVERIAPEDERAELAPGISLPLIRLPHGDGVDPTLRLGLLLAAQAHKMH